VKGRFHISLACSLLMIAAGTLLAEDKPGESPYYPLRTGTTWHYKVGDNKLVIRVAKQEKVGDVPCALLEASRDGKVVGSEHLAVTADGVYRHTITKAQGDKPATLTLKPPMLVLKLPPKKGDAWKVDSQVDGKVLRGGFKADEQEVKVPAGTYKAIRVTSQDLEVNGLKTVLTMYYAEGVGMVKQVIQEGENKVEIELEKFEAGK
jgi:hypothetical protein